MKRWDEVAGYGYAEGVRPRSVLGRVVDTTRALVELVRVVAVYGFATAVLLLLLGAESLVDACFEACEDSLPPCYELNKQTFSYER